MGRQIDIPNHHTVYIGYVTNVLKKQTRRFQNLTNCFYFLVLKAISL
jgi:hypothetical protein